MLEKRWIAVPPQAFTANGTADGKITVADSSLFKVKQTIILASSSKLSREDLEVKRITDINTIYVGLKGDINARFDVSGYLVSDGAFIAANEQLRSKVPEQEIERLTYEEEPVVARRVVLVDKLGNKIDNDNPLPVNASVSIGDVQVDLDFDPNDQDGSNSSNTGAYIRDSEGNLITSTQDGTKQRLDVDIGGAIVNVDVDGFNLIDPDSILMVGSEDGLKNGVKHATRVDSELDLRVGISDGANKATVSAGGELSVSDATTHAGLSDVSTTLSDISTTLNGTLNTSDANSHALLTNIDNKLASIDNGVPASLGQQNMAASMPVVLASNQTPINVNATLINEPIKISGTIDGQVNGTEYNFVYNLKQQILASHDREEVYTYADFGNKNQRVTKVEYNSNTFPGVTVRRSFNYTLVGTQYRRDNSIWEIV